MPTRMLEELASRKKEKIATFLTFESIVAVLITFLPLFMLSGSWPLLLRVPICAGAAALGYLLTLEVQGLALYERLFWLGRGLLRLRLHGGQIGPKDLPGAVVDHTPDAVIAVNGPIEWVERQPGAPPREPLLVPLTCLIDTIPAAAVQAGGDHADL